MTPLQTFAADHRVLLQEAAAVAGLVDPIAFDPDEFAEPLLTNSVRGPVLPMGGVLVRDWYRRWPKTWPGVEHGARLYTADGLRFVHVVAKVDENISADGYNFYAVSRRDYASLYRLARKHQKAARPPGPPPVLSDDIFATLKQNTLDFLNPENLKRIRALGGRPKRGLLFSGPPGNGKTSACRWILQQSNDVGFETKQVSPDDYRQARGSCNAAAAVRDLFKVESRGVIFFDDMDLALRDRKDTEQPEDQAVFLGAMDGIDSNEGVVYIFTTNLPLERIDPAFKRPGRLDVALDFPKPDAGLRRRLIDRWNADLLAAIDRDAVVHDTQGQSFAEIEELKNLMVLRYVDAHVWEWSWAKEQFEKNRQESLREKTTPVGFLAPSMSVAETLKL